MPAKELFGGGGSSRPSFRLNLILLLLTVLTTTLAGALQKGRDPFSDPLAILAGVPFSFSLLAILGIHEFGHYTASRRHRVAVSLPYFIPAPSIIGTFGAFIKMKSPLTDRRALLDIGVAGPLAGILVAIPVLFVGLKLSEVIPAREATGIVLGESLLFKAISWASLGPLRPEQEIVLHPVGFAGWLGLLVTSLNLIPIGQLDGGHVAYALLGERWYRRLGVAVYVVLLLLGAWGWLGWLVWALVLYFLGFRHPVPLQPHLALGGWRKWLGWLTMALLVLTFTPVPFKGI